MTTRLSTDEVRGVRRSRRNLRKCTEREVHRWNRQKDFFAHLARRTEEMELPPPLPTLTRALSRREHATLLSRVRGQAWWCGSPADVVNPMTGRVLAPGEEPYDGEHR